MAEGHGGDVRAYRQPNTLTEAERAELVRRYNAGEAVAAIAEAFGLSEGSASKLAHDAGCPRRQVRGKVARPADFDPAKLAVVEWEGEPRVVDTVLGAALGYDRPDKIRQVIYRKRALFEGAGSLAHRGTNLYDPKGGRPSREFLLNREQVNLAILLCGLPNVDGIKAHVAKVFTAWEEGRLKAADLETAVALQDSAEAAAASAPDVEVIKAEVQAGFEAAIEPVHTDLAARLDQALAIMNELRKAVASSAETKRKDPSAETKRIHIQTVAKFHRGLCPCCHSAQVVSDGKLTADGCFDHKTGNRAKNGLHETWLVCSKCNADFERPGFPQQRRDVKFAAYQLDVPKDMGGDLFSFRM